jgi:hypothetical protein
MATRRGFLNGAGATGILFCSCGILDIATAQNGPRQLPITVNGKRVRTIDVHSHCLFHESLALMGDEGRNVIPPTKGAQEHFIAIENRLRAMDAMAIARTVIPQLKSSNSTMKNSQSFAPGDQIVLQPSRLSACNFPTSRCSSLRPR